MRWTRERSFSLAVLLVVLATCGISPACAVNNCGLDGSKVADAAQSGTNLGTLTAAMSACISHHYGGELLMEIDNGNVNVDAGRRVTGYCENNSTTKRVTFYRGKETNYVNQSVGGVWQCKGEGTVTNYAPGSSPVHYYSYTTNNCPAPNVPQADGTCGPPCNTRPEVVGQWAYTDYVCSNNCTYAGVIVVGGANSGKTSFSPTGATCFVSNDLRPPTLDTDQDGEPDETDDFPNDPGETKDSDGDGIGDNNDAAPNDPNNGADSGGGSETDNNAVGGGVCGSQPPVCVGDGILCNTLFQMYKARCALEEQTGILSSIEDGVTKIAEGEGPTGDDDTGTNSLLSDLKGIANDILSAVRGDGATLPDPGITGPNMPEEEVEAPEEWDSGVGGSAACPAPFTTSITLNGTTTPLEFSIQPLCDFSDFIYWIILAIAAVVSAHIVVTGARI